MRFENKVAAGAGASSPGWSNGKAVSVLPVMARQLVIDGGLSASALGYPWADNGKNL